MCSRMHSTTMSSSTATKTGKSKENPKQEVRHSNSRQNVTNRLSVDSTNHNLISCSFNTLNSSKIATPHSLKTKSTHANISKTPSSQSGDKIPKNDCAAIMLCRNCNRTSSFNRDCFKVHKCPHCGHRGEPAWVIPKHDEVGRRPM